MAGQQGTQQSNQQHQYDAEVTLRLRDVTTQGQLSSEAEKEMRHKLLTILQHDFDGPVDIQRINITNFREQEKASGASR